MPARPKDDEPLSQQELAILWGLSNQRISQLEIRTLAKIKQGLLAEGITLEFFSEIIKEIREHFNIPKIKQRKQPKFKQQPTSAP